MNQAGDTKRALPDSNKTTGIPDFSHPNWLKLVKGELTLSTKVVAFSMLLSRIQAAYIKAPTMETGITGVRMLRQFFMRNDRLLANEIAILNGTKAVKAKSAPMANDAVETSVPAETSDVWRQFAGGDLRIATKQVSLQLLLAQFQKGLAQNPSEETVRAFIRNMRNYLIRNERQLADEIRQIREIESRN